MLAQVLTKCVQILFVSIMSVALCDCSGINASSTVPRMQVAGIANQTRLATQAVQNTSIQTDSAVAADEFVDSIGVNTHFTWGAYNARFPEVRTALIALGLRHIRDSVSNYTAQWSHLEALADAGIHSTINVNEDQPMDEVLSFPSHARNSVEAFEGPNEVNNSANWPPKLRAFQHLLYTTIKGSSETAKYPVIGPALGLWRGAADYDVLGDISADMDYGNVHDYFGGNFPDNGAIPWLLARAPKESGTKPIVATETGFCTSTAYQGVPLDVQGDYIPRVFFDQYLNGIKRSLDYELIDEQTGSSNVWQNCGLLQHDLTPKPSYYALKNTIALLTDRGPAFKLGTLTYSISDSRRDVHHMLLQKRDGTFYLAIWLDTSQYNQATKQTIGVMSRLVTLTSQEHLKALSYYRLRSDGSMISERVAVSGQAATILVADSVGFLHISR